MGQSGQADYSVWLASGESDHGFTKRNLAKESLKSGQVLYFCLTGDVIFSEKYTKEVKEETEYWGKAQSTISKLFQAHPNFSEWSRGNYYNKVTGLYYRPWISFTWIDQIHFISFCLLTFCWGFYLFIYLFSFCKCFLAGNPEEELKKAT